MNKERMIEEFIELVTTDSETKYEANIAALLKKKCNDLGLEVTEDDVAYQSDNQVNYLIINMLGSVKNDAPIFFTAHMDTVTPGVGIKPHQKDGYLTSDGTNIL